MIVSCRNQRRNPAEGKKKTCHGDRNRNVVGKRSGRSHKSLGGSHPGLSHPGLSHPGLSHPGLSHSGLSHSGLSHSGLSPPGLSHSGLSPPDLSRRGLSRRGYSRRKRSTKYIDTFLEMAKANSTFFEVRRCGSICWPATSDGDDELSTMLEQEAYFRTNRIESLKRSLNYHGYSIRQCGNQWVAAPPPAPKLPSQIHLPSIGPFANARVDVDDGMCQPSVFDGNECAFIGGDGYGGDGDEDGYGDDGGSIDYGSGGERFCFMETGGFLEKEEEEEENEEEEWGWWDNADFDPL